MPKIDRDRPRWYRQAGMGMELGGAILGCAVVGIWIDRHFATAPWGVVSGLILGTVGGLYNLIRQSLRILSPPPGPVRKTGDDDER